MKILLTGAAGFIGLHIASALAGSGHEVVGVDALLAQAHGEAAPVPDGLVVADIRTADLDELLKGIDVVCHQAAVVGNGVDAQDFPDYAAHNDYGTAVLLAAMARSGVKDLVLASSMVVYGDGRYHCAEHGIVAPAVRERADLDAGIFDPRCAACGNPIAWQEIAEDAPFNPRTSYAASKVAQEHYAGSWCTLESAPARSLCAITMSMDRGCPRTRHMPAIERVAEHRASLTAYNAASGQPFTIGAMAEQLAKAAGGPASIAPSTCGTLSRRRKRPWRTWVHRSDRSRRGHYCPRDRSATPTLNRAQPTTGSVSRWAVEPVMIVTGVGVSPAR